MTAQDKLKRFQQTQDQTFSLRTLVANDIMKYIQDDGLSYITSILTDCPINWNGSSNYYNNSSTFGGGGGAGSRATNSSSTTRILHGKLEAYSRKRAGTDKKYANQLGSTWTAYQEQVESDAALLAYRNMIIQQQKEKQQLKQVTKEQQQRTVSTSTTVKTEAITESSITRKRSYSVGNHGEDRVVFDNNYCTGMKKRQQNLHQQHSQHPSRKARRRRSNSLNIAVPSTSSVASRHVSTSTASPSSISQPKKKTKKKKTSGGSQSSIRHSSHLDINSCMNDHNQVGTTLGDLSDTSTRRLLTDLILTLNMSFPDYDFGSAKPDDFYRYPNVRIPMKQINEKLFDLDCSRGSGDNFLYALWKAIDNVIQINACDVISYQPNSTQRRGGEYTSSDDDPLAFLEQTFLSSSSTKIRKKPTLSIKSSTTASGSTEKIQSASGGEGEHNNYHTEDVSIIYDDENVDDLNDDDEGANLETVLWTLNYFFVNKTTKRILLFTCIESMRYSPLSTVYDDDGSDIRMMGGGGGLSNPNNDSNHHHHLNVVPLYLQGNDDDQDIDVYDDDRKTTKKITRNNSMTESNNLMNIDHRSRSVSEASEPKSTGIVGTNQKGNDVEAYIVNKNQYVDGLDEGSDDEDDDNEDSEDDDNDRNNYSENSSVAGSEDYDMDPESMVPGGIPISHAS